MGTNHLPAGTMLGSYRLGDVLGEGSMGTVYVATHTRLDRRVAIKVLRPEYNENRQALKRFFAEARAVNKIAHPNVIEITDFVEEPGALNYYVMELLEGVSLAELVQTGGILELSRTVAIMTHVAEALGAVHRAGIVHRDVKPHNVVLIERAGQTDFVKLVDFGTARLVDGGDPVLEPTAVNSIVGTPRYMAPEQALTGTSDYRSDIYSFGAVLYELVTGRPPLPGADFNEIAAKLRSVEPIPPSEVQGVPHEIPRALDALIMACLAKNPASRPERIEKVAERLVTIADEQNWLVYELSAIPSQPQIRMPTPTSPPPLAEAAPLPPPPARSRWWLVAAIAAVALAAGAVVLVTRARSAPDIDERVEARLAIADQRIAAGRFVAPGGDEALDHLLAARALDPDHPGVRERLAAMARKFERLADEALAAGSLPEAAAHYQTVLVIEPDNGQAAAKITAIEEQMLARQRGTEK